MTGALDRLRGGGLLFAAGVFVGLLVTAIALKPGECACRK